MPSSHQRQVARRYQEGLRALLAWFAPIVALFTTLVLALASQNIRVPEISSTWLIALLALIQIVLMQISLRLLQERAGPTKIAVVFVALSVLLGLLFGPTSAYVAYSMLRIPKEIDFLIVAFTPLAFSICFIVVLERIRWIYPEVEDARRELEIYRTQYEEAVSRPEVEAAMLTVLATKLGARQPEHPLMKWNGRILLLSGGLMIDVNKGSQLEYVMMDLRSMAEFLVWSQRSAVKKPSLARRIIESFCLSRWSSLREAMRKKLHTLSPSAYPTREAYEIDRALFLSDFEIQEANIKGIGLERKFSLVLSYARQYPSKRVLGMLRGTLGELHEFYEGYVTTLTRRARLYDKYVKLIPLKWHNIWKLVAEAQQSHRRLEQLAAILNFDRSIRMRWDHRKERILTVLDKPLMSNEVAARVDLSPSHTRRCLHRLENEGLVKRIKRDIGAGKTRTFWKRR